MKRFGLLLLAAGILSGTGCAKRGQGSAASGPGGTGGSDPKTIRLIMSDAGFNAEVVPILKAEVEKQGFVLQWVVVNDIIQPNKLVDDGSADANSFQHEPYFDQFVLDHGLRNVTRGFYTVFGPSGLYSRKYKRLEDVPDGATFGIPVDPSNNGRALFMLRDRGLLKMRPVEVTHASQKDITENPHQFHFKEVDQLMLQRALEDVDVGFLFSAIALKVGLDPEKDALAREDVKISPYKGIVAIRKDLVGTPKIKALRNAYASAPLKAFYQKHYGNAILFLDHLNLQSPDGRSLSGGPDGHRGSVRSALASLVGEIQGARPEIVKALGETLYMLLLTVPLAVLLGTPVGTLLYLTRPGSIVHAPRLYLVLNGTVNLVRSFPFLILMIALIPVTRMVVGTALGTTAATVPMVINSIPYFARFIEQTLLDVNRGVVEAAVSMGANRRQIVWKVLYLEARSGIASSVTILTVSFLSYSTVAGLVGGGGIGDFAIRYGYYRYQTGVMFFTVFLIVAFVQVLQFTGNLVVRKLDKRI